MSKKYINRTATKEEGYFIYARDAAQDRSLSWQARGLLAYLMSQPANWRISIPDLEQQCSGRTVYRLLKELITAGYVRRELARDPKTKRITAHEYYIQDKPLAKSDNVESGKEKNKVENLQNKPLRDSSKEEESLTPSGVQDDFTIQESTNPPTPPDPSPEDVQSLENEADAPGMKTTLHECGSPMKITSRGCICSGCGRLWYDEGFHNEGKSLTCKGCGVYAYDGNIHDSPDPDMESEMLEWETELCQSCLMKSLAGQSDSSKSEHNPSLYLTAPETQPETITCPTHGNQPVIHGQCATCYTLAQSGVEEFYNFVSGKGDKQDREHLTHDGWQNGKETDMGSAMSQPDTEGVSRLIDEHTAMKNAIVVAFGWKVENVTDQMWGIINKTSAQLRKVGAKPEDMSDLVKFCKGKEWGNNMKPSALPNWYAEWCKSKQQTDEPFLGIEIK